MSKEYSEHFFMRQALNHAHRAARMGEVPVGAVIAKGTRIVGIGINRRESCRDAIQHAEIEAIQAACKTLQAWRLVDCTLFVTLEPCLMCAGAIHQARLSRVVYGAMDPKAGAMGSLYRIHEDQRLNHQVTVESGVLEQESQNLLKDFFRDLRLRGKGQRPFQVKS